MKKYLDGESLDAFETTSDAVCIDYDAFNKNSRFEFGYCTELLLQLLNEKESFDYTIFKSEISDLGNSIVISVENDKVRVHIHAHYPEKVFALCHRFGEFLSLKVENMTVQHTELDKRILCSDIKNEGAFSVVAVAYDFQIQKLFAEMGADVVICAEDCVSTKDYLDAFEKTNVQSIFVFPNSSDAILSAMQAKKLYKKSRVTVLNSRTVAECYAVLPTIDFAESDIELITDSITEVINNLMVVSVARRDNAIRYRDKDIHRDEYYSFSGKELIAISRSLEDTVLQTIKKVFGKHNKEIVTVFYRPDVDIEINRLIDSAKQNGIYAEYFTVAVENLPCLITISFE